MSIDKKPTATDLAIQAVRHSLASIDLSDIQELDAKVLTPEEYMQRAIDTELFWKNIFEPVIKLLIHRQLVFLAEEANTNDIQQFSRGTINGLGIVRDWFEEQVLVALSRFEKSSSGVELGTESYNKLITK